MKLQMKYIILYAKQYEECICFYRDVLQLPIKGEHGTYVEFDTGSTILAINSRDDVQELTGLPIPKTLSQSSTFEIGFVVDDVDETIHMLKKHGVTVLVEPVTKPWGQTVSYVSDPDGNYIEICSSLD
ncbi:VOC family protein [Bacillus multifaciens]|uniref:VOC family protein n=1 Tax=Bacillus multifaciens TaxID=3068506 RepID=UPI002740BC13|nr:VOC family protein [Bacillus sp. WLY-B-L8]MDP7978133.1 VOC family protein [Bacillus sp. WLY-B-L8]